MEVRKKKRVVGPEVYQCDECDMTFKFKTTLKHHQTDHIRQRRKAAKQNAENAPKPTEKLENMSKTYKCDECASNFKSKAGICGQKRWSKRTHRYGP